MRVFMTADAVGGVWTYATDLARGLAERGDAVTLAVAGPSPSAAQRAQLAAAVELLDTGLPLDWTAAESAEVAHAGARLAELASRSRAQVVHLNSPAYAADAAFPAPVVGVAHSCLASWQRAVRGEAPPPDFAWRIAATGRGYAACDAVIAPSASFAAETAALYGVSPYVVRNGRAAAAVEVGPRDIAAVAAGRLWDEGKGLAMLDAAAARLPEVAVEALGADRDPDGRRIALPNLHLSGPLSSRAVLQRFARSRLYVSPALYEPFGLSVLEAAQAGCALVLSDIATFRELWDGAAVFTPPRDAEALASTIARLLADAGETARLSAAARIRADRYDVSGMVEGTAAIHRAIAGAPRRAGAAA